MRTVTSHIVTHITSTLTTRGVAVTTIEVRGTEMYECKNCQNISSDSELRLYIYNFITKSQVFLQMQTIHENTRTFYLYNKLIEFAVIVVI